MASSPSGRYQSRLLNWLSQGFSQIEKLQPHIRGLKTRVAWGIEVVFFSAYRLSQMVWFTRRRLGQTDQEPFATGMISPSQAIQEILTEIQESKYGRLARSSPADLDVTNTTLTSSHQDVGAPILIQGIATLLDTRTLVLVDEQNQLLDILTPDQQSRLCHQITQKVAGSRRWNPITQAAQQHLSPRLQTALGQMLAWMPRRFAQPIITRLKAQSITGRQLQESSTGNSELVVSSEPRIGHALTFLDSVSLRLEQQVEQIIHLAQRALGYRSQTSTPDQMSSGTDELRVRGLIRAAIAYFFNLKPQQFLSRASTQSPIPDSDSSIATSISGSQQLPPGSNQPLITDRTKPRSKRAFSVVVQQPKKTRSTLRIKPDQEQPWLTMTDLFGGSAETDLVDVTSGVAMSMISQSPKGRLATQITDSNSVAAINSDVQVVSQAPYLGTDDARVDIETEAILMEYVKHPLEQALAWLDQSLAWLEEMVIVLWSHLQPYWAALLKLIQRYWHRYF